MFMTQNYLRPQSLEEAWQLNQKKRNRIIGGMLWLKMSNVNYSAVIDLSDLGLDTIEETDEQFSIGAMVTLRTLEQHEALNAYCKDAFKHAVQDIIGVQFRNLATVGGSLWGRFGFSDVLTVLLSMDCQVELYKGGIVSLEEFAAMKKDNDILVRLIIRKTPGKFVYQAMRIQRTDFPVLNCAVSCMNGEYKAVVGARPAKAMVIRDCSGLLKNGVTADSAAAFGAYAAEAIPTGSNVRGSSEYRSRLISVLTRRCLLALGSQAEGGEA